MWPLVEVIFIPSSLVACVCSVLSIKLYDHLIWLVISCVFYWFILPLGIGDGRDFIAPDKNDCLHIYFSYFSIKHIFWLLISEEK